MTIACDIIIRNFPLNFVYNAFFSLHQRKESRMSFLRVNDLLFVCVVLNHDADSSLYILETCVLTHLSTIISLMKYTCKDGLNCTVHVTNEHIVHQLILLIFFCIGHTPENFKRKQTPAVHTILLRVI